MKKFYNLWPCFLFFGHNYLVKKVSHNSRIIYMFIKSKYYCRFKDTWLYNGIATVNNGKYIIPGKGSLGIIPV